MTLEAVPWAPPEPPAYVAPGVVAGYLGGTYDYATDGPLIIVSRSVVPTVITPFGVPQAPITFSAPFPNGLATITFSFGDNVNLPTGTPSIVFPTLADFTILLPGSVAGAIRINYTAIGW